MTTYLNPHTAGRTLIRGLMLILSVTLLAWLSAAVAIAAPAPAARPAGLSFNGVFQSGLTAWGASGGGPQCANYGTPSTAPRIRGDFTDNSSTFVGGIQAGRFDLPASQPNYPLQACELTNMRTMTLGADDYYGYMFYVPVGWNSGGTQPGDFWGISTAQFHFQNIWGSPVVFELHNDHMTLALETGVCNSHVTADPGCQWRSNADNPGGDPGNLGAQYVVPAPMRQGVWHEVLMHVHWAADSTGQIQVWHRILGSPNWAQTVNLSGYPTVQWDATQGCCSTATTDKVGAYRGPASAPVSVWEANILIGNSFSAVSNRMPTAPGTLPVAANPVSPRTHARTRTSRRAKARAALKARVARRALSAQRTRRTAAIRKACARQSAHGAQGAHGTLSRAERRHRFAQCLASHLRPRTHPRTPTHPRTG